MGKVRGKGNRTTELRLRFALVREGIRGWKLHIRTLPGKPDFYFPDFKLAVFVDGCFWHGCETCGHIPNTNRRFWSAKLERNQSRDAKATKDLQQMGCQVIRFWEHELTDDLASCITRITRLLSFPVGREYTAN